MSVGFAKQCDCLIGLAELQISLAEQVAQLAEPVSRGAEYQQPFAQRNSVLMTALGDHSLHIDEPGLGLIVVPALIRKEELDRLAGLACNVLQGGERGAGAASLDQVDRGGSHTALSNLGETKA